jgi:RNA polymerase sigma-70 factor (ECF subfamily)
LLTGGYWAGCWRQPVWPLLRDQYLAGRSAVAPSLAFGGHMRDSQSFDDFYLASVRRVTSYVHAWTGNLADAEDIVQEAFAKAWQHWGKVGGYADPEGWVRTVAFRHRVSVWRKATTRLTAHRLHGPPGDEPEVSPDYVAIIAALRKIPEAERRAIVLHHIVGLTVEDVAAETGVAQGTVKARLHRGRHRLSGHLTIDDPVGRSQESIRKEMHGHE